MKRPSQVTAPNTKFIIVPGHHQGGVHWVKISVQLVGSAFVPFFFYITTQASGACADWAIAPASIGRVGGSFLNSTNGNGVTNGRGGLIGSEYLLAGQLALSVAGVWVLTDNNGFCDFELLGTPGTNFYSCVAFPGYSGVAISRQIVAADFSS